MLVWLVISFSPPGRARNVLEWLGATHLYVALGALFLNLVIDARADGSIVRLVAFGFLLLVFSLGLCVSLFNTLRAIGGATPGGDGDAATH